MKGKVIYFIFFVIFMTGNSHLFAQPTITLSSSNFEIVVDDFSELMNDVTLVTYLNVTEPPGPSEWDLFASVVSFTSTSYSAQGTALTVADFDVRAINSCETPNREYPAGFPPVPPRISGIYTASFGVAGDNYIVGTAGAAEGPLLKNVGPCSPGTQINGAGSPSLNPTTHAFRIEFEINLSAVAPFVRPGLYDLQINFNAAVDGGGVVSTEPFRIEIDIQPILQLKMSTTTQIDFIFTDIKQYLAGITKYGTTILEVNSSINWDLMAIGTSNDNEGSGGANFYWDNPVSYTTCVAPNNQIPLEALEIHQTPTNPSGFGVGVDYSPAFQVMTPPYLPGVAPYFTPAGIGAIGSNNIEVGVSPYLAVNFSTGAAKTIGGNWGIAPGGIGPGSYQIPPNTAMSGADRGYRYIIDYRLVPGLPVTFGGFMTNYACPGIYVMQVKFLLSEDQ